MIVGYLTINKDAQHHQIPNNFSNYFEIGTNLYKIPNIDTNRKIAVQIDVDHYIMAINEKYLNKNN